MNTERKSFAVGLGEKLIGVGFEVQEGPVEGMRRFTRRTGVAMALSDTLHVVDIIPNDEGMIVAYSQHSLGGSEQYRGRFDAEGKPISEEGKTILKKLNLSESPPQS